MAGVNIGGSAVIPPDGTVPYIGTYFDVGTGFNFHYVGMFMGAQDMSGPMTTPTASFVEEPALSPDGTLVAFIEAGVLWTIKPNGLNLTNIQDPLAPDYAGTVGAFQWAPDSTHILFACVTPVSSPENEIFTIDLAGVTTSIYTHSTSSKTYNPRYNDAQTKILFSVVASASLVQIWSMDADGTNAVQEETVPTQFSGGRTGWWEGNGRYIWNDGTLVSPVWKAEDLGGGNVVTLSSGSADSPRRNNETFNPDGLGYLVWDNSTPTDINSIAFDGTGSTDFATLDVSVATGFLYITPTARFFDRMWWDSSDEIWSAPLSDLTDQRDETINGDGVGVNFGLSG